MFETIQKFSERTGLSYSAIRKLALTKQLPHVKVGNRYMIHIEKGLSVLADLAICNAGAVDVWTGRRYRHRY